MKVLSVCRGAPGLGRVVPSVGLSQTLARTCGAETIFASYAAGYAYLAATGHQVVDLGRPDGLFIDSVAPQALQVLQLAEAHRPNLILVDGEFFLPAALAHLDTPVVYIANPHDLLGPANTFRRVNRLLLAHADAVIISSLNPAQPGRTTVVPNAVCLQVRPIIKEFRPDRRPDASRRVLISMGGGSIGADPAFQKATDDALTTALDAACALVGDGRIDAVTVVLGADGSMPQRAVPDWLTVLDRPVELTSLYRSHDVFMARAGRNATAEALYCGIPTVLLPVTADRHRGSEQASNAAAATAPHIFAVSDWQTSAEVRHALIHATARSTWQRTTGGRGNEDAATFLANLLAGVDDPPALLLEPAERSRT